MALLSAIVPAYNCEKYLKRAIESLLATQQPGLEVLVIDDGSKDKTGALAADYAAEYPDVVRFFRHDRGKNRGAAATRNLGIRNSRGEFLCFLDGDDYVHLHRFNTSLPLLRNDSSVDAVYELTRLASEDGYPVEECFGDSAIFGLDRPVAPERLLPTLLSGPIWHANSVLIRRSFLTRTGLFCENLRTAEDCHLWYRMAALGRIVPGNFHDSVSTYCRREGSLFRPSWEARRELMRAMAMFEQWLRHADVSCLLRREIQKQIRENFETAIAEARRCGKSGVALSLAWHAFRQLPAIANDTLYWRQIIHIALSPIRTDPIRIGNCR
jgi:GT2 family glycosyltransferase